jgi:hypothetical protein
MTCRRFAGAAVLEAYDEATGTAWKRHLASCEACSGDVADMLDVRRLYAQVRPLRLHARTRSAIVSRIRREQKRGLVRSAVATLAAVGAAFLLVAGMGGAPSMVAAAEPAPSGFVIDGGLVEIQERIADLETDDRAAFDVTLDELKHQVGSMTWDAENM